jgi:D-tyrosyl-tRNA(Tyr) deacylase
MNESVAGHGAAVLAISQFTLYGDVKKGKRPSFGEAMEPQGANALFEVFCQRCRENAVSVETGRFRAHMRVELENVGPVTILMDTKKTF